MTDAHGERPPARAHILRRHESEDDFEAWLAHVSERVDPFMAWLGVVFALLVGFELAVELSPSASRILTIAGWTIWSLFLLELLVDLWLAPRRRAFLRRHWIRVLLLVLPTLRFFSFLRLLRLGRALPAGRVVASSYRTAGTARRLLRSRLGYLGGVSVVVAIAVAELAYVFERDLDGGAFPSFADAVLWSLSVVIALQGDPLPTSVGARLVMLVGFVFGLVVIATLAGSAGAFFVDERRERAEAEASGLASR